MNNGAYEVDGSGFALASPAVRSARPQTIREYMDWVYHLEKRARLMEKTGASKTVAGQGESRDLQPKRRLRSSERIVSISASRPLPYSSWAEEPDPAGAQANRLVV